MHCGSIISLTTVFVATKLTTLSFLLERVEKHIFNNVSTNTTAILTGLMERREEGRARRFTSQQNDYNHFDLTIVRFEISQLVTGCAL